MAMKTNEILAEEVDNLSTSFISLKLSVFDCAICLDFGT